MLTNFRMRAALTFVSMWIIATLAACGGGGNSTTPTTPTAPAPTAAAITLSASSTSVQSDNSTTTTITATVTDAANAAVTGVPISFSADTGFLTASSATSDATGKATVTFSSGTTNSASRTATITATASGKTTQIPIRISGATVTVTQSTSSLVVGGVTATLTVNVRNSAGAAIANQAVSFASSGTGSVLLTPTSGTTDASGNLTSTVAAGAAGPATVTITTVGETRTATFTVSAASVAFQITAPATDPSAATLGTIPISVTAPSPTTSVVLATTLGTFASGGSVVTLPVSGGVVTTSLTTSNAGVATIQAYDTARPSITSTRTVSFTAGPSTATRITLQTTPSVVAPSSGGTAGVSTLIASVFDIAGNPVGGAAVSFTVLNPTGGGETINPAVATSATTVSTTNALGQARTTFTAGSLPSGAGGVQVRAFVVGTAVATGSGTSGTDATIVIGGTAGSIAIGQSTVISDGGNGTIYTLPMSVLVADSNGNAVANAVVSLSAWPIAFNINGNVCSLSTTNNNIGGTFFYNEDANENLVRDSNETGARRYYSGAVVSSVAGTALTPPNSAAGTLPATVTTGTNGVATFTLTYTKSNAAYIIDRIRARTLVQGTETVSQVQFALPVLISDVGPPCLLGSSPYF